MAGTGAVGVKHGNSYNIGVMTENSKADTIGGTPRAAKRPAHVKAPESWTNDPVPPPEPIREDAAAEQPGGRNPVRYGDWELKGLAIDF
jgi:hypothetical protein